MAGWRSRWSGSSCSAGAPDQWALHFGGNRIGASQTPGRDQPKFYSVRRRGGPGAADARAQSWASSDSDAVSHPGGIGESRRRSDVDSKASHPPDRISLRRARGTSSSPRRRRSRPNLSSSTGGSTPGSSMPRLRRSLPFRRSARDGRTSHAFQVTPFASVKVRNVISGLRPPSPLPGARHERESDR